MRPPRPGSSAPRPLRRAGRVGLLAGALGLLLGVPAGAHGEDPTLVPVLRAVTPALPEGLAVQVRTGVSEQIIVVNPTAAPLLVLDPDGDPFLRVSTQGAFGNVADPFFHRTLNPPGVPLRLPKVAQVGADPQWVRLSPGPSWGWFEPRLHPFTPGNEPLATPGADPVVADWQIGLRYDGQDRTVTGVLERQAVTGAFRATLDPRPDDLSAVLAQGRVPAVLLIARPAREIVIGGSDGADFLRLTPAGAFANPASANFRDNPDLADLDPGADGWVRVGEPGRIRWLDSRLQYGADRPPLIVEQASKITEIARWEIPMRVDGDAAALRGSIDWVPRGAAATPVRGGSGLPWAAGVAVAAFGVALLALAVVSRQRSAAQDRRPGR